MTSRNCCTRWTLRHRCILLSGLALLSVGAVGQRLYDAAAIHPSGPNSRLIGIHIYPGGRLVAQNQTLVALIEEAFGVQAFQIEGGPKWVREDRFDVQANPTSPVAPSGSTRFQAVSPQTREMLRALLAERFGLKVHNDSRPGTVLHLIRRRPSLLLQPAKAESIGPWVGAPEDGMIRGTGIAGSKATMDYLAATLSKYVRQPVENKTNLAGEFDFRVKYAYRDGDSTGDSDGVDVTPSLVASLNELGLQLKRAKGRVDVLVIDSARRPEN